MTATVNLKDEYNNSEIQSILDILDEELIGLKPVKTRIREISSRKGEGVSTLDLERGSDPPGNLM